MDKQLLQIVTDFNERMDTGFAGVYKRMDKYDQTWGNRFQGHETRIVKVEKNMAVKKAVNNIKQEDEKETKDFWKWIIRTVTVAAALGLLGTFWSLIRIAHKLGIG